MSQSVLDSYCWMYATFNIPESFKGACAKKERQHDGTTLYNSYYQWVSIFLVVSAILFYLPRAIWLMAEGGLMKFLAKGTTTKIIEDADEKREKLLKTFTVSKMKRIRSKQVSMKLVESRYNNILRHHTNYCYIEIIVISK